MFLLQVYGHVSNVRDALIQIVLRLRDDVLKDREDMHNASTGVEALYAGSASLPMPPVFRSVPSGAALSYDQRSDGYGYSSVCF